MNKLKDSTYILIDKFHSGQASTEEVAMLHEWKGASQVNVKLYDELIQLLELVQNLKDWKQFDKSNAWDKLQDRIEKKPLKISWMLSIAAAILLLVFATTYTNFGGEWNAENSEYLTGSQQSFSILEDGTELFLTNDSRIKIDGFSKSSRALFTEGNYFVHVAHDKQHPFTIKTDKISIEVLGTSFKVEEDEEATKVKVRDGKVLITNMDGSQYTLKANESFILENGHVNISKLKNENWGLYARNFEDESISHVLNELAKEFGHLKIDKAIQKSDCRITTKIGQSTIIEILEEIDLIFNIDYTIKDGTIVVNKISC
ncbi:FecR family protein [Portibacter lacus]|uniref:FecR protein domain-containing protein n=1 Tax=Portibacter lacus TaxID=1099794 RepID=A0AA37ST92_9BACT|nr:FecR family protein [Portibacter lacus]GLR18351.1 hypothetical protein GCM10007940_29670 [Portibacter lacus]